MQDDPAEMVLKGAAAWNEWRGRTPGRITFSRPGWYDSPGPGGVQIKGRNRLDFAGVDLSDVDVLDAFAEGLDLHGAVIENAVFEEGDFSRATFAGATLRNTRFNKTILTGANFDGASIRNCNLNRVNLVGASFRVEEITETVVYGIAAWDLETSPAMRQSKLVVERTYGFYSDLVAEGKVPLTVDDIELAQFIHYLTNHKKLRDMLNLLNERGVLLLGRFRDGGLERLHALRDWFAGRGYMAMIFDFARPDNLDLLETVVTMAGLSRFVVADLSGPRVPGEVHAILAAVGKPVLAFGDPRALPPDVAGLGVVVVDSGDATLLAGVERNLAELERRSAERIRELADRFADVLPPPSPG
jgi:uncharacterized protein YjbI with pentapeptide repeats